MLSDRSQYLASNNKLLDETLNDFSQKPFLFASLNEIVKRADFNKGSFYYRFQNKEDLYLALIDLINAQHIPLYNEAVFSLKKPHRPYALAMAAFESLKRLNDIDSRFPLVLERFSQEDDAFQSNIRAQSVAFVFDRLRSDIVHAGFDWKENEASLSAITLLYHGVMSWPIHRREVNLLRSMIEALFPDSLPKKLIDKEISQTATPESLPFYRGLTLVLGSRQSGKTSLVNQTTKRFGETSKRVFVFDGQTREVRDIENSVLKTVSLRIFAKQGFRRLRHPRSFDSSWADTMRLHTVKLSENPLAYALFEAFLRKPDLLVLDEPALFQKNWEFPPIFEALLKFSAANSTMIATSHVNSGLWEHVDRYVFVKPGADPVIRTRNELKAKYPAKELVIRYLEANLERTAKIPLDPSALQAFQDNHRDAAILGMESIHAEIDAMFKQETGEELL